MQTRPLTPRVLLSILILSIFCGCSSKAPPPIKEESPQQTSQFQVDQEIPEAVHAEQAGDLETAAQIYLRAAETQPGPTKYHFQLRAIQLLIKGNYIDQAHRLALSVSTAALSETQTNQLLLLHSKIALSQQNPELSLQHLNNIAYDILSPSENQRYFLLKADTHATLQQPENSFLYLSQAMLLTESPEEIEIIENRIWSTLLQLPPNSLEQLRQIPSPPDTVPGWLDLFTIYQKQNRLSARPDLEIAQWQTNYPEHPASQHLLDSITALQEDVLFQPQVIAILLPQTGPFAKAANAIKTGLIAAFLERNNPSYAPELQFYDTGELTDQALNAYDRAIQEGAELVIGPLRKDNVSALALRESLPVPTLALNRAQLEQAVDNLYLFGLSPEDEAQQIAEKAWLDGYNHSLTLVPEGGWGERLNLAFEDTWVQYGGKSLEQQNFNPTAQDFTKPLRALLNLDESRARIKALKQLIGSEIRTEPRRRQDVDFIFLASRPQQARQIRPQLKFFYAESIPVYATSHVYTGMPDPKKDHDMNDIVFCDIPWVLEPNKTWNNILEQWPNRAPAYIRLYALGVDSYNIISHLRRLSAYKFQQFPGQTGTLTLNELQQIKRQLLWARFVNGKPKRISSPLAF